jgi:hypothetical protein
LWPRFEFVVRIMLRLSILSSVIPLVLVGGAAHDWTAVPARHCFAAATADPPSARSLSPLILWPPR